MEPDTGFDSSKFAQPTPGEDTGFDEGLLAKRREASARRRFDQLYDTGRFKRNREEIWRELENCAISLANGGSEAITTASFDTALAVVNPRDPNKGILKPLIDACLLTGGAYVEGKTGYEWQGGKDISFRTGGSPRAKLQVFDFSADPGLAGTLEESFFDRFSRLGRLNALAQKGMRHELSKQEMETLDADHGITFLHHLHDLFKRYYPGIILIFIGTRSVWKQQWSQSSAGLLNLIVDKVPSVLIDRLSYGAEPELPYGVLVAFTRIGIAGATLT